MVTSPLSPGRGRESAFGAVLPSHRPTPHAAPLVRQHRFDGGLCIFIVFVAHDPRLQFRSLRDGGTINLQRPVAKPRVL